MINIFIHGNIHKILTTVYIWQLIWHFVMPSECIWPSILPEGDLAHFIHVNQ